MKLESYFEEIQRVKDALDKEKSSAQRQIDFWLTAAIEEHAKLKAGDVVAMDNRHYKITGAPELRYFSLGHDKQFYDLVYTCIKLKPNGQPYHDSQSGMNRREIWQRYLERGVATKIGT